MNGYPGFTASNETERRQRRDAERRRMMQQAQEEQYLGSVIRSALGYGGGSGGGYGDEVEKELIDAAGPSGTGSLDQALGGRHRASPQWQVWGRGYSYPTGGIRPGFGGVAEVYENREATNQPRYYEYSGGSPDPTRMAQYPASPWMWDRSGSVNYGSNSGFGGARGSMARMLQQLERIKGFTGGRMRVGGR
jgi:hypothetical protein